MVLKAEYQRDQHLKSAAILKSPEAFTSPIDGTLIDDRGKLREHNKKHGVTDIRDYGEKYFDRKQKERSAEIQGKTPAAKRDRVEALKRTMHLMEQHNHGRRT